MKTQIKLSFVLISILVISFFDIAHAQPIKDPNDKMLSKAQLIEEYTLVYQSLINYHPTPYMYIRSEDLDRQVKDKLASFIVEMSIRDFHVEVRKLVAAIKCGHTFVRPSELWYKQVRGQQAFLPFDVNIKGDSAVIRRTIDQEFDFAPGDQLLEVNGVPMAEILRELRSIMERDGTEQNFVDARIMKAFTSYFLFLYGVPSEIELKYKKDGQIKTTTVIPTKEALVSLTDYPLPEQLVLKQENKWSKFAIDEPNKLAYLKIKTFADRKEFKDYYDQVFEVISSLEIEELILDLRANGGGFFGNGNRLLTYLVDKPFDYNFCRAKRKIEKNKYTKRDFWNRLTKFAFSLKPKKNKREGYKQFTFSYKPDELVFTGKLKVLIDGGTFSQGSLVSAELHGRGATFYGSESGGTESGTNAVVSSFLTLPYSGIRVKIPYYQIITNFTKAEFGRGVIPEYILPSVPLGAAVDTQLESVLQ